MGALTDKGALTESFTGSLTKKDPYASLSTLNFVGYGPVCASSAAACTLDGVKIVRLVLCGFSTTAPLMVSLVSISGTLELLERCGIP